LENLNLKKAGLKVTVPRMKILSILENHVGEHLSAEDVYKKLLNAGDDVGLATVYRVLTQFESAGLVSRHNFEGGQGVFELDDGEHHDHLMCTKCGKIVEFCDDEIEKRQTKLAEELGMKLIGHNHYLFGECIEGCEAED